MLGYRIVMTVANSYTPTQVNRTGRWIRKKIFCRNLKALIWYTLNSPSGGGQGQISMPLCGYPLCTLHHFVGQTITCTVRAYASFSLHTIYMYIYYNYIDHNIILKVLRVLMPRLRC